MDFRCRLVPNNQTTFDLVDIFQNDNFTRISGLTAFQVPVQVFLNNVLQPWGTISGSAVSDAQVLSGYIYWSEAIPGSGIYSTRWRPNAVGFWRLSFTYAAVPQIVTRDYDVAVPNIADQNLKISFIT